MGQDPFKERPVILAYTYGKADATRGMERSQDEQNTEHCADQYRNRHLGFCSEILGYWITGSVALFSDALESTVNVATALVAFIAIRVAAIPEDENHPMAIIKPN